MSENDQSVKFILELYFIEQFGITAPSTFHHHLVIPSREWMELYIQKVRAFYSTHSDDDIAMINEAAMNWWSVEMSGIGGHLPDKAPPKPGFVYLIKHSEKPLYKIGITVNPEVRIKGFNSGLPFTVEEICTIATDDMRKMELNLHNKYLDKRVNGEWFALEPADVEYIKSLAEGLS